MEAIPAYLQDPSQRGGAPMAPNALPAFMQSQAAMMPPTQAAIDQSMLESQQAQAAQPQAPPQMMGQQGQRPTPEQARASALQNLQQTGMPTHAELKKNMPRVMEALQQYLPKDQAEGVKDTYKDLANQSMADQKAQLDGLSKYIDQIAAKPKEIDWSPLAAFVDARTGSHFAPVAEKMAPMTDDEKDKMLFGLRQQLAQGTAKMSAEQLAALKEQQNIAQAQATIAQKDRHDDLFGKALLMRGQTQQGRLELMQDKQAIDAGKDFEKNPIILQAKKNLNSLTNSSSILENTTKPLTAYDLDLAYNDYINSVAVGGAATEGKIHRELPDSFAKDFNRLRVRLGENADLRQSPEGRQMIELLKNNIKTVRGDLGSAVAQQNADTASNYAVSRNPYVQQVVAAKNARYGNADANAHDYNIATTALKPAPHGDVVKQGGKTYKWDGSEYKEAP